MTTVELVERVRVLDLQQNDVVVFEITNEEVTMQDVEQLEDYLQQSIRAVSGAVPIILLPGQKLVGAIRAPR